MLFIIQIGVMGSNELLLTEISFENWKTSDGQRQENYETLIYASTKNRWVLYEYAEVSPGQALVVALLSSE